MAIYRNVHTSFWEDTKVLDLMTPEDRYFMLYLLTNPHTNQIGCYEISKRQISNETGYNFDTVEKLLQRFDSNLSLIKYSNESKEVLIKNWYKYNWSSSPKVKKCIESELKSIKNDDFKKYFNKVCIPYVYGIDTHMQEEQEQEQEEEQKQIKNSTQEMFDIFWNKYPKKVSKAKAKTAFFKIKLDDVVFSNILNSLEKFKKTPDWKKDKGQYIPYPASWLNQKRWEDEFVVQNENEPSTIEIDPELEKRFNMKAGEMYE